MSPSRAPGVPSPAGFRAPGCEGAWNKASAFLGEGVPETRPVTGQKTTAPSPKPAHNAQWEEVRLGSAPQSAQGSVDAEVASTHVLFLPTRPPPAEVPNRGRFRAAELPRETIPLLCAHAAALGGPILETQGSSRGALPIE